MPDPESPELLDPQPGADVLADPSPAPVDDPNAAPSPANPEPPAEPARNPKIERRFRDYAQKVHELERENEELRRRANTPEPPAPPAPKPPEAPAKPKIEDFDTQDEFLEALTDYKARAAVQDALEADRKAQREREQQAQQTERQRTIAQKMDAGYDKYEDFDIVNTVETSPALVEELQDSEQYADLAYHLAKHPDELKALEALSGKALTRAVITLENKLATQAAAPPPPPPPPPQPKITQPVAPTNNAGGSGSPGKDFYSPNASYSHKEYVAARKAGKLK